LHTRQTAVTATPSSTRHSENVTISGECKRIARDVEAEQRDADGQHHDELHDHHREWIALPSTISGDVAGLDRSGPRLERVLEKARKS
jgi:hypothetical protein